MDLNIATIPTLFQCEKEIDARFHARILFYVARILLKVEDVHIDFDLLFMIYLCKNQYFL